jgi:hypothetical protein
MRRLAARRTGRAPDNKPGVRGRPVALLAGGFAAGGRNLAINLQPEPGPGAAAAAVENLLRREVSC